MYNQLLIAIGIIAIGIILYLMYKEYLISKCEIKYNYILNNFDKLHKHDISWWYDVSDLYKIESIYYGSVRKYLKQNNSMSITSIDYLERELDYIINNKINKEN